jgi:hypothetical protein
MSLRLEQFEEDGAGTAVILKSKSNPTIATKDSSGKSSPHDAGAGAGSEAVAKAMESGSGKSDQDKIQSKNSNGEKDEKKLDGGRTSRASSVASGGK